MAQLTNQTTALVIAMICGSKRYDNGVRVVLGQVRLCGHDSIRAVHWRAITVNLSPFVTCSNWKHNCVFHSHCRTYARDSAAPVMQVESLHPTDLATNDRSLICNGLVQLASLQSGSAVLESQHRSFWIIYLFDLMLIGNYRVTELASHLSWLVRNDEWSRIGPKRQSSGTWRASQLFSSAIAHCLCLMLARIWSGELSFHDAPGTPRGN